MGNVTELNRRLDNMIRRGRIAEVDLVADPPAVRVETGGLLTDWLPWFERRAGGVRTWSPPSVGEGAVIFCPSGDPAVGFVLPGLMSDDFPPPSRSADEEIIAYPDGARQVYNHASGAWSLSGVKTVSIQADVSVTIDSQQTTTTGNATIEGSLTFMQGMTGYAGAGAGGVATFHGSLQIKDGDVVADGISVKRHKHGGILRGGAVTDEAQA